MRRSLVPLFAATVLVVACADSGDPGTTTSSSLPVTTSTVVTTTTSTPSTTTTTLPAPTTTVDPLAPGGSGCTPGTTTLPDGEWYGEIGVHDDTGIGFDLACWFFGEGATAAAAEDGEESPPPNDYYVRNENDEVRFLAVTAATPVVWFPSGDPNESVEGTYEEWVVFLDEREFALGTWVTITDGAVSAIEEQWVP